MNKLHTLIAGLVVFAAMAQVARAAELVNELADDAELDDELEGGGFQDSVKGFESPAAKKVGVEVVDQYGRDTQNPKIGQAAFVEARKRQCVGKTSVKTCQACCSELGKAYQLTGRIRGHCSCFDRHNNYSKLP